LGLFPVSIEHFQRQLGSPRISPPSVLRLHPRLDVRKAPRELVDRATQRALGVDLHVTREADGRDEGVAHLLFARGTATALDRTIELADLLTDLRARPLRIGPVEADALDLLADPLRPHERRETARHAAEQAAVLLLLRFDALPVGEDLVRRLRIEVA